MFIQTSNFDEVLGVGVVREVGDEGCAEGIVDLDLDVVDCGLGVLVEGFVGSDGVLEFDWGECRHVGEDVICEVGDVAFLSTDELCMLVGGS